MSKSEFNAMRYLKSYIVKSAKQLSPEVALKCNDVLVYRDIPMLRAKFKDYDQPVSNKEVNGFVMTSDVSHSPFDILGLTPNTAQQTLLESDFTTGGSYLFNMSCGGGKTLAGIELIHRLGVKTLIVSARCAVNDQWVATLKRVYPKLNINTRISISKYGVPKNTDIFIITPQYLSKFIINNGSVESRAVLSDFKFDFIIYDEVHALLADKFASVLVLPMVLKSLKVIKRLPYMLGLTASLPAPITEEYALLKNLFGNPVIVQSQITRIPVRFMDFRDTIPARVRKRYDENYEPLSAKEVIDKSLAYMLDHHIKPSVEYKLIIMTHLIDDTVYAAVQSSLAFQSPVVIVRANSESDYYFTPDEIPDDYRDVDEMSPEDRTPFTLDDAKDLEFMHTCDYPDVLGQVAIIVGTDARLKEGFNCHNLCYGICTQFLYSDTTRVQILGRIRRSSTDAKLNAHERLFIVNSGVVPSNIRQPRRVGPPQLMYDFNREEKLFKAENYIRISMETSKPISSEIVEASNITQRIRRKYTKHATKINNLGADVVM